MVLFSGELDKAIAAFIIANGAAAYDHDEIVSTNKGMLEKAFGWIMPRGPKKLALSKMNFAGLGPQMIKHVMKKHNALSLPQLIELAREQGIKLVACTMTMDLLGLQQEELIDGLEYAGVAAYLGDASQGKVNLFI
ncbi:DsrE/DsrF/DrsH-like family protein [Paenibacillus sp. SER-28]